MKPLGMSFDLAAGIVPLDLQTARTGDYVSLKNAQGVAIIIFKGVGTAAQDPVFTLNQATAVAGTGAKACAVISTIYKKQGPLLSAVSGWTEVTQAAATTFTGDGTSAEEQAIYVIQVDSDELDVDNGFDCISVDCADVGGNEQLGCVLYLLYGLRHQAAPANLPDPLVD